MHAHTVPKAQGEPQVSSQDVAPGQEPSREKAHRREAEDKLLPRTFIGAWAQREYDQEPLPQPRSPAAGTQGSWSPFIPL